MEIDLSNANDSPYEDFEAAIDSAVKTYKAELRSKIEAELRSKIEAELRSKIEAELRSKIEAELRPEIEASYVEGVRMAEETACAASNELKAGAA